MVLAGRLVSEQIVVYFRIMSEGLGFLNAGKGVCFLTDLAYFMHYVSSCQLRTVLTFRIWDMDV
jgi:hypothetical protein